jgi:hypothetical protein
MNRKSLKGPRKQLNQRSLPAFQQVIDAELKKKKG